MRRLSLVCLFVVSFASVRAMLLTQPRVVQPAMTAYRTGSKGRVSTSTSDRAINVRDHGAMGDGVTDDTFVLQAAIDAAHAAGGGEVFCPVGTYLVSATLDVKTGVTLRGGCPNSLSAVWNTANTVFVLADRSDCDMVGVREGVKNVTVSNIVLNCNGANQASGNGIHVDTVCTSIDHCKVLYAREKGIVWSGGYGYITFTDAVSSYQEGLYVSGGDLTVFQCEFQDSDYGNTGSYPNVHLTSTSSACVFISTKCGNDNSKGQDGILIDANSNVHRFLGCYLQNNTRYGINNNGFRCTFNGCTVSGKRGPRCHAFYENGSSTLINGCTILAGANGSYGLYVVGGSPGYWCRVASSELSISAGGVGFYVAAGKAFYRDGILIAPSGSGDTCLTLTLAPNTTNAGDGAQIRVGTSTDDGVTGISIRGTREAAGGYGGWKFYTRNAGGEQERVNIDKNGLLTGLAGMAVKNNSASAGYLDLYEDSDEGENKIRLQPTAMARDYKSLNGMLVLDNGANSRVTLTFKAGVLVDVTTDASQEATAAWTAD